MVLPRSPRGSCLLFKREAEPVQHYRNSPAVVSNFPRAILPRTGSKYCQKRNSKSASIRTHCLQRARKRRLRDGVKLILLHIHILYFVFTTRFSVTVAVFSMQESITSFGCDSFRSPPWGSVRDHHHGVPRLAYKRHL